MMSTLCVANEQQIVERVIAEAKDIVNNSDSPGEALGELIARYCDLQKIALEILGRDHAHKASEFAQILKNVYTKRYGTQEKVDIFKKSSYTISKVSGNQVVTLFKGMDTTEVVWVISQGKIIDIQIEGISMVMSEKKQFLEAFNASGRHVDTVFEQYRQKYGS